MTANMKVKVNKACKAYRIPHCTSCKGTNGAMTLALCIETLHVSDNTDSITSTSVSLDFLVSWVGGRSLA